MSAKITNHTDRVLDFLVKGPVRDGVPSTGHVDPGATETLDLLDADSAQVKGLLASGAITIVQSRAAPAKPDKA
jgi:hypothetical protein